MRLVGMAERALALAAGRALSRSAFGGVLAAQGSLREVLARQRVALDGAKLLVLNAAHALDWCVCGGGGGEGGGREGGVVRGAQGEE